DAAWTKEVIGIYTQWGHIFPNILELFSSRLLLASHSAQIRKLRFNFALVFTFKIACTSIASSSAAASHNINILNEEITCELQVSLSIKRKLSEYMLKLFLDAATIKTFTLEDEAKCQTCYIINVVEMHILSYFQMQKGDLLNINQSLLLIKTVRGRL
ncbi:hypothetical protein ACJX0J_007414, partial [Zea mays]